MFKYSAAAGNGTGGSKGVAGARATMATSHARRRRTSVSTPVVARAASEDRSSTLEGPRRLGRGFQRRRGDGGRGEQRWRVEGGAPIGKVPGSDGSWFGRPVRSDQVPR